MAGSDAGDDEDDSAMATVPTEKVDSDEDSDRGSDHSGLKRKSLAMKVSVGWGQEGGPARGTPWLYHGAFLKPTMSGGGGETNSFWILWWKMGLSMVLGVSQLSHDACGVVRWPVLVGFAAWRRIQSCRSECSLLQGWLGRVGESPSWEAFAFQGGWRRSGLLSSCHLSLARCQ